MVWFLIVLEPDANTMKQILLLSVFSLYSSPQQSKLQLIEEALERVLMTHSITYERGKKIEDKLADVTYTYTGNTVIDAKQDSTYYYVYGTYTFSKYTYVRTPNPLNGGSTSRSYNNNGSRSYVARVKSVLDDYRVQDILVVDDPDKFDFQTEVYDSLKTWCDWVYPTCVYQPSSAKKGKD